ncbi:MAG: hypothetical protein R2830_23400 [Saprospiraceae bacterium]
MHLKDFQRQPTAYELRKLRKCWKESLEDAENMARKFPERRDDFMGCHIFNMVSNASLQCKEHLLDELDQQYQAIRPDDKSFRLHIAFNRATLRIRQGRMEEAVAILKPLADRKRHHNYKLKSIGIVLDYYAEKGDFKKAADYVHRYLSTWNDENKGDGPKSYLRYAGLPQLLEYLGMAGEYENVIRIGKDIIELFGPDDEYLLHLVGQSYLELKDEFRALHYLTQALKIDPDFAEIYVNLGAFYWNEKNEFETSIRYMTQAATICEKKPEYKGLLATVYRNLANLHKLCLDMDTAAEYRRKQFEAMDSLVIFDLIALFGSDKETMSEFRLWVENHSEVYDNNLSGEEEEEEDYWEEED